MRGLRFLIILAIGAATSGCQQYYEGRIDKLYTRCDVPQMPPLALQECLDQTRKLAATYSSPRLDALLAQLERSTEPPAPPPAQVRPNEEEIGQNEGNDDPGAGRGDDRQGEDGYGEEPFQPDYDSVPPPEPEQPPDPD